MADSSSARPKCRQDVLNLVHVQLDYYYLSKQKSSTVDGQLLSPPTLPTMTWEPGVRILEVDCVVDRRVIR